MSITVGIKVKKLNCGAQLPEYTTDNASGADLFSNLYNEEKGIILDPITINPGERRLIKTGISIELPPGLEAQIRPRSGLALKKGISIVNSPGTIDADYRGDIGVIIINHGSEPFTVSHGERIAQMVIAPIYRAIYYEVDSLSQTVRGDSGFGHTGIN